MLKSTTPHKISQEREERKICKKGKINLWTLNMILCRLCYTYKQSFLTCVIFQQKAKENKLNHIKRTKQIKKIIVTFASFNFLSFSTISLENLSNVQSCNIYHCNCVSLVITMKTKHNAS